MNEQQLTKIEEVFKVRLPFDFKNYIATHPDTIAILDLTWSSDPVLIKKALMGLFEDTLRFDIENGDYWPIVFGERPSSLDERVSRAMEYTFLTFLRCCLLRVVI